MRLLIDVPDTRAAFFLELLKQCSFVKTTRVEEHPKPAARLSHTAVRPAKHRAANASKEEVLHDLQHAIEDVKLHQSGSLKLKTLDEVLDEL